MCDKQTRALHADEARKTKLALTRRCERRRVKENERRAEAIGRRKKIFRDGAQVRRRARVATSGF